MERCCSGILRLSLCDAELLVRALNWMISFIKLRGRNPIDLNPSCPTSLHCSTCDVSHRGRRVERILIFPFKSSSLNQPVGDFLTQKRRCT